jgi:hypothetical protein
MVHATLPPGRVSVACPDLDSLSVKRYERERPALALEFLDELRATLIGSFKVAVGIDTRALVCVGQCGAAFRTPSSSLLRTMYFL